MASSRARGAHPSTRAAFSLVAFFVFPSSGTAARASATNTAARRMAQSGACRVDTRRPSGAQAGLQDRRDGRHRHEVTRDREEALARGGRMHHRAQVQVGDVAHIHDPEHHPRQRGNLAVQHAAHEQDRAGEVWAQHGTEDRHRVDDRQLQGAGLRRT